MNDHQDNRRPEEIEREIERTRAEFSSTIDAIQSKLTPGQLMDQALSYARTSLPADFGSNLGNTVRNNPVPVTLIGIGIAWLAMSGQQPRGSLHAMHGVGSYRDELGTGYRSDLHGHDGRQHEGTLHRAAAKASEMGHRISDTTSSMADRARDMAHGTRARAGELGQRSQERYYRTREQVNHMAEEQPLMLGALGVAVGTLLGALLPATRREDEMMGHTRDELVDKARDTAREYAPAVKESARRVADTAREELERNADGMHGAQATGGGRMEPAPGSGSDGLGRSSGAPGLH